MSDPTRLEAAAEALCEDLKHVPMVAVKPKALLNYAKAIIEEALLIADHMPAPPPSLEDDPPTFKVGERVDTLMGRAVYIKAGPVGGYYWVQDVPLMRPRTVHISRLRARKGSGL